MVATARLSRKLVEEVVIYCTILVPADVNPIAAILNHINYTTICKRLRSLSMVANQGSRTGHKLAKEARSRRKDEVNCEDAKRSVRLGKRIAV